MDPMAAAVSVEIGDRRFQQRFLLEARFASVCDEYSDPCFGANTCGIASSTFIASAPQPFAAIPSASVPAGRSLAKDLA